MVIGVTNFEAQVITQLEQTLLGLGGTIPAAVQPGNFQERLLQLLAAIALRLGVIVPAAAVPGNPDARLLQLLVAIALTLGGSVLVVSGFEYQVLNQLEQILLGLGGTVPAAVQPGNYPERFLQLLVAIAARSSSYSPSLSKLTWTAQNNGSYTYFDEFGTPMTKLYDGIKAAPAEGMTALVNDVFVHARLDFISGTITSLSVWAGQFNGSFNFPTLIHLYSGFVTSPGIPIYSATPTATTGEQIFTLPPGVVGRDFTIRFFNSLGSAVSVFELELYGT